MENISDKQNFLLPLAAIGSYFNITGGSSF